MTDYDWHQSKLKPGRVVITVYGRPQQRGSKRAMPLKNGKVAMVDDNKRSGPWMSTVAAVASEEYSGELMRGPIELTALFYFKRPSSHFGTGRNAGILKASAPDKYAKQPDLSKLMRAVEDALTGVVWHDDRQVCRYGESTGKYYTLESEHAVLIVEEL